MSRIIDLASERAHSPADYSATDLGGMIEDLLSHIRDLNDELESLRVDLGEARDDTADLANQLEEANDALRQAGRPNDA